MKKNTLLLAAIILALARSGQAQTPVQGTSLTIQGYTDGSSVYNEPIISLEKDNTSGAPYVSLSYVETGGVGNFLQLLGKTGAQWQWQTLDGSNGHRLQMQLDTNNVLSLVDPASPSGNPVFPIVINPDHTNPQILINNHAVVTVDALAGFVPLVSNGLTVGANGNVGIGTSNPGQQLTITGNFEIPTTTATAGAIYQNGAPIIHTYGDHNEFFGNGAGNFSMTGGGNVGIGTDVLQANTSGSGNIALGYFALASNVDGFSNIAIGPWALTSNTHGWSNIAIGEFALMSNQGDQTSNPGTGFRNTAIGQEALHFNTSGAMNNAIGFAALRANTSGSSNTAVGDSALGANTTGSNNTVLGAYALASNSIARANTALGCFALFNNQFGEYNVAVGEEALSNNIGGAGGHIGGYNTALGALSLNLNTLGGANAAVGVWALAANTTGDANAAMGAGAGGGNTAGQYNTFVGTSAGNHSTTGNYNIFIGTYSGLPDPADGQTATQHNNSVAIGYNARVDADHAMVLGGTGGDALNVGINTTKPQEKLDVNGNAVVRGVLHVAPGGDIDMGAFTAGTNPTLPPP